MEADAAPGTYDKGVNMEADAAPGTYDKGVNREADAAPGRGVLFKFTDSALNTIADAGLP
jgi:hypothetical protein